MALTSQNTDNSLFLKFSNFVALKNIKFCENINMFLTQEVTRNARTYETKISLNFKYHSYKYTLITNLYLRIVNYSLRKPY